MVRHLGFAILLAAALSAEAAAQTMATAPAAPRAAASTSRGRGADIGRDEYVQRAVERARRAAETRFDRLDANHDGVLTAEERRAGRATRRGGTPQ